MSGDQKNLFRRLSDLSDYRRILSPTEISGDRLSHSRHRYALKIAPAESVWSFVLSDENVSHLSFLDRRVALKTWIGKKRYARRVSNL